MEAVLSDFFTMLDSTVVVYNGSSLSSTATSLANMACEFNEPWQSQVTAAQTCKRMPMSVARSCQVKTEEPAGLARAVARAETTIARVETERSL